MSIIAISENGKGTLSLTIFKSLKISGTGVTIFQARTWDGNIFTKIKNCWNNGYSKEVSGCPGNSTESLNNRIIPFQLIIVIPVEEWEPESIRRFKFIMNGYRIILVMDDWSFKNFLSEFPVWQHSLLPYRFDLEFMYIVWFYVHILLRLFHHLAFPWAATAATFLAIASWSPK